MSDPVAAPTRIRLDVAYDGTGFNGWTRQPGLRTVQGQIEAALATLFRRYPPAPALTVAGRTDAGVHARAQVAHTDLSAEQLAALLRPRKGAASTEAGAVLAQRINGILGPAPDVVVSAGRLAAPGFDARFSAIWRRYEYRIADHAAERDPLQRLRTTWYPRVLNVDAMDRAAGTLVGLHDFAAYCKPRDGATTIRTLQEYSWRREADGVLVASVRADAFCRSMVRSVVGACVAVGEGKLAESELVPLRDVGSRSNDFIVMPARGLTLMQVGYPPDAELAERAQQTRTRRSLHPSA